MNIDILDLLQEVETLLNEEKYTDAYKKTLSILDNSCNSYSEENGFALAKLAGLLIDIGG